VTFTILTLFPEIFDGFLGGSILARAIDKGLVDVRRVDIRDFATDRHRICDDYSYGGGPGMVLKPEPLAAAIESVGTSGKPVVYLTPAGRLFSQALAREFAGRDEVILICGRYEGIDQRIIDSFVTDEVSMGDYVLSGGEVAAMAVVDAVSRLVPGVITEESLAEESFSLRRGGPEARNAAPESDEAAATGGLLEYPHYTRPEVFRGMPVPEVLLSGHHEKIRRWRLEKSVEKTMKYRPELLASDELPREVVEILREYRGEGDE
jgi:tRNA (guanine37-N1)-methyltransferase